MRAWMIAVIAAWGALTARAEVWTLSLPDTGLLPSYVRATFLGRMHERHGGSHMGFQEYTVNLPLADPRRSHVGSWWYNIQGNATLTMMDVGGALDLRRDELLMVSLPLTLIKLLPQDRKLMFTVMPRYAGDGVEWTHAWDVTLVVDYNVKHSETLSYSVGLALSPRFAEHAVMPYLFLSWQATPQWLVRLRNFELAALYGVSERLQVGPALSVEGGSWMVDTPEGARLFRVRSLAATMLMEYDFTRAGESKRVFSAAAGMALASTAELCRRNASKDTEDMRHYKPGLMLSMSVDFRF